MALRSGNLGAAELSGRISYDGPAVKQALRVEEKRKGACGASVDSPVLIADAHGNLKNAVVILESRKGDAPENSESAADLQVAPAKLTLDQKNCRFDPHVAVVTSGGAVEISNTDPMAHDVRAFLGSKIIFQFEMDAGHPVVSKEFNEPGVYVLRCGLHKWMHAYVIAVAHPYFAVTSEDGSFSIFGIPEGNYRARVWHEKLGEVVIPITFVGEKSSLDYTFSVHNNPATAS